jgi:hypothetical protein
MNEEKRAMPPEAEEDIAQRASDHLKAQIAALRARVRNAHHTLSQHAHRERGTSGKD